MFAHTDLIIKTLDENGITFLPYDEDLSIPESATGSIEWLEHFVEEEIGEKTGYSPKMYADVTEYGIFVTSLREGEGISFNAEKPEVFVSHVKSTMKQFYSNL